MGRIERSPVLETSISERLRLVEAIWDSIAEHPEALPLSDAEREELDRACQGPDRRRPLG